MSSVCKPGCLCSDGEGSNVGGDIYFRALICMCCALMCTNAALCVAAMHLMIAGHHSFQAGEAPAA